MSSRYNHRDVEPKWRARWADAGIDRALSPEQAAGKKKAYVLEMFPYPSGRIHVGHSRNYTMGDVIARFRRANGYNVLHPMGWDAFGLPAENAAMERGIHPKGWTYDNIDAMRAQLKLLGLMIDWSRELATCDPAYYKHQQAMFLAFWKKGLVYRKKQKVNWDPVDNTVLANEQVVDGKGWRSGAPVETRELEQWMFKVTAYAEDLLAAIEKLAKWPDKVRLMQSNWIGKSQGARIWWDIAEAPDFLPASPEGQPNHARDPIEVYTTRPDTLFGASFLALAPDHPLTKAIAAHNPAVAKFIEDCAHLGTSEADIEKAPKFGVDLGVTVRHPFDPDWILPVWGANFVLSTYGTGAIFGSPAGDQRDLDFANKYKLPFKPVVLPPGADAATHAITTEAFTDDGVIYNSGFLDGLSTRDAIKRAIEELVRLGKGEATTQWRLRDWGVSRQRYWGCPIPAIHCAKCGVVPAPESSLPIALPEDVTFEKDRPGNPLDRHPTWKHVDCPQCGGKAQRETDTLDTFVDSSWYFARFTDAQNADAPFNKKLASYWLPVDQYVGGVEHAVLHLLYARFWHKVLFDLGFVSTPEPFQKLVNQGLILGEDGQKMSKSRGNVVNPDDVVRDFGADALRLYEMFMGPLEQVKPWSMNGVEGVYRFLARVWRLIMQENQEGAWIISPQLADIPAEKKLNKVLHETIKKCGEDIEKLSFNTAISQMMVCTNAFTQAEKKPVAAIAAFLRVLSPFAPHLAEELNDRLRTAFPQHAAKRFVADEAWPQFDPAALIEDEIEVVIQVNGKLRDKLTVPVGISKDEMEKLALASPRAQEFIGSLTVRKVIVVPGKLVNIVAN